MLRRILSLLVLALIVTSASILVATRYSKGEASFSVEEKRMKVLRRKGQLKLKPTAREITSFNNGMQEQKRELEDKIPKNVPIKVKVRVEKEKGFKDLNNRNWLSDFELEVTNTSNKPIYFLELWLMLPDTKTENNRPLAFSLRYGRDEFIDYETRSVATDVPIQPNETYTFVIPEGKQQAWRDFKVRRKEADPKKVRLKFIQLNFGDGTGFNGGDALPYPYRKGQASTGSCREAPKQTGDKTYGNPRTSFLALRENLFLPKPAAFLPVKFSLVDAAYRQPEPAPAPDVNCPGTDCIFAKSSFYQCVCSSGARTFQIVGSAIAGGHCHLTENADFLCEEFGVYCTQWDLIGSLRRHQRQLPLRRQRRLPHPPPQIATLPLVPMEQIAAARPFPELAHFGRAFVRLRNPRITFNILKAAAVIRPRVSTTEVIAAPVSPRVSLAILDTRGMFIVASVCRISYHLRPRLPMVEVEAPAITARHTTGYCTYLMTVAKRGRKQESSSMQVAGNGSIL
jgi:hypothetical protein